MLEANAAPTKELIPSEKKVLCTQSSSHNGLYRFFPPLNVTFRVPLKWTFVKKTLWQKVCSRCWWLLLLSIKTLSTETLPHWKGCLSIDLGFKLKIIPLEKQFMLQTSSQNFAQSWKLNFALYLARDLLRAEGESFPTYNVEALGCESRGLLHSDNLFNKSFSPNQVNVWKARGILKLD